MCFSRDNALHNALDGGLAEVIRIGFHGQTEDTDDNIVFLARIIVLICFIRTGDFQHTVCNVILASTVSC